jgi:hypothetical protein
MAHQMPNLNLRRYPAVLTTCLIGCAAGFFIAIPALHGQASSRPDGNAILQISTELCADMKARHVLGEHPPVGCDRLRLVKFAYVDFDGQEHRDGEIIVMDAVAEHVARIFGSLHDAKFPIAKARLMTNYGGDDDASMSDNNTSAFNDREVTGGGSTSLHAYGLAIDINPVQNPYTARSGATFTYSPPAGIAYANRSNGRPWKAGRQGLAEEVIDVFAANGFFGWGGYWDSPIDYQHFQVNRKLAERLVALPPQVAKATFDHVVKDYRGCRRAGHDRSDCIMAADRIDAPADSKIELSRARPAVLPSSFALTP